MIKTLFYSLIIFLTTVSLQAQIICKGTVVSFNEEPIAYASVTIKNSDDMIIHFAFTNEKGEFSITLTKEGDFVIEAKKMGFEMHQQPLIVNSKTQAYNLSFILEESSELLEELVIEINHPVKLRGDTLIYDAKSFSTGREIVVEDLLKNIPGITIDKSGTIRYESVEIEKVMVEGDDFFNKGYSILTQNMPSKPLNKVEVLRKYSNNKLLKGVEESNKVALNLTIDEEYRNLWFGDMKIEYGLLSENRYNVTGNLMNFSKKYKSFLNYGLNNVGVERVGALGNMFRNNNEVETIGSGSQLYSLMGLRGGRAGRLKDHRTRINNTESISISSIASVTDNLKIKGVGFLGADENYAFNNSYSVTNIDQVYFENFQKNQFKSHLKSLYINVLSTYDFSSHQLLQISSVLNKGTSNNANELTFNDVNTLEQLRTKNSFFDQKITYTNKWKDKNVMLLKARYFTNKIPQMYTLDDYLMDDLFSFNADAMNNDIKNEKTFTGIEADFKLKQKNDDLIDFQFGLQHSKQMINTVFNLFNDTFTFTPDGFQSNSSFTLADFYAKSKYLKKWRSLSVYGSLEVHQLYNQLKSTQTHKQQTPFYINPSINFSLDIDTNQSLRASYLYNHSNTSFIEVNDTYILTSSRSFSKGIGEFKLTDSQNANIGYSIRHYLNRYRVSFDLNYSKQNDIISSRSSIEQNSSLSESVFIKGGDRYGINLSSNYYFPKLKSNVKVDISYSQSTSYNEINGSGLRKNIYNSNDYSFEWRSNFKSAFNFHFGAEWEFFKVTSPDFVNDFTNGFNFLDVFYMIDERLDIKVAAEHYFFGSLSKNQRNHIFLDFEATYKLKGDKWTLGLRGNNLLDKTNFTTYHISDIGYSSTSYRLMSRYALLSAKYRFSL